MHCQSTHRIYTTLLLLGALLLVFSVWVWAEEVPVAHAPVMVELTAEQRDYLAQLGPITVAPDPDWMPYEYVDEQGRFIGIAADLLELVAQRLGIEFTYVIPRDWDEALAWSKAGEVLILPFLNQTPAREEWLVFTEPLLVDPNVFITREEHPFIFDATQLTDETIVFPVGTSMEERVRRDFPNLHIVHVETEGEVFRAVEQRDADMTLRSLTVAAYTIRKEGLFNLKIAGQAPEAYVNRLRMGVLKEHPMLRDILNQGIATITPREREEIVNRHVNITIVTPMDYGFILRIAGVLALLIGLSWYWNQRLRKINSELAESERSKSVLLSNLPGMAYQCYLDEHWTMLFVSEGCFKLTGYTSEDLVNNRTQSFANLIVAEDKEYINSLWSQAALQEPVRLEYRIMTANQEIKWVFEQGIIFYNQKTKCQMIEGLIIDITERKRAEEKLYYSSTHDSLTQIYNRHFVLEQMALLIEQTQRQAYHFSLVIMDIDFFKKINDQYGHPAGDYILKEFAAVLAANCRPYDIAGRYGGEEFIMVVVNINSAQTQEIVERIQHIIRTKEFVFAGQTITCRFSAGVVNTSEPHAVLRSEWLISTADQRLYQAKHRGRDRVVCG